MPTRGRRSGSPGRPGDVGRAEPAGRRRPAGRLGRPAARVDVPPTSPATWPDSRPTTPRHGAPPLGPPRSTWPSGGLAVDDADRVDGRVVHRPGPPGRSPWAGRPHGPLAGRPLPRGPARPGRRHHRVGQVRAAADPDRQPGAEPSARTGARSCSSTTRAAPPSPRRQPCRTPSAWSPTSTARRRLAHCARSTAELTRREAILAAARRRRHRRLCPTTSTLARLVIVVDEFATLAEELPAFVPGPGRASPSGGAPWACTSCSPPSGPAASSPPRSGPTARLRICLRTTDEADSRDVLGTADAAHLPVDLPGRAYLRSGSGHHRAAALQVARVAAAGEPSGRRSPRSRRWTWPASAAPPPATRPPTATATCPPRAGRSTAHARTGRSPPPHRPWRPPLPDHAPGRACRATDAGTAPAPRAAGDRPGRPPGPAEPATARARPRRGRHMAGRRRSAQRTHAPCSGPSSREAVRRFGPDELHVHVLESGGGSLAAEAAGLPHAGTAISGEDALRTRPAGRPAGAGGRRPPRGRGRRAPIRCSCCSSTGWRPLSTLLDEADPGTRVGELAPADARRRRGRPHLRGHRRPGGPGRPAGGRSPGTGWSSRCPTGPTTPWPASPPGRFPSHRPPGRALLGEEALECQLALPRPLASGRRAPDRPVSGPVRAADPGAAPADRRAAGTPTRGVLDCPSAPAGTRASRSSSTSSAPADCSSSGPPGSGRSTAAGRVRRHLRTHGVPLLRLGCHRAPSPARRTTPGSTRPTRRAARAWADGLGGRPGVVVADDVGSPVECAAFDRAAGARRPRRPVAVIAAGSRRQLSGALPGPGRRAAPRADGPAALPRSGRRRPARASGSRGRRVPVRPGIGLAGHRRRPSSACRWLAVAPRRRRDRERLRAVRAPGPISCVAYQASS